MWRLVRVVGSTWSSSTQPEPHFAVELEALHAVVYHGTWGHGAGGVGRLHRRFESRSLAWLKGTSLFVRVMAFVPPVAPPSPSRSGRLGDEG